MDAAVTPFTRLPVTAARMLAVETLLADPEALDDDVLESCLYLPGRNSGHPLAGTNLVPRVLLRGSFRVKGASGAAAGRSRRDRAAGRGRRRTPMLRPPCCTPWGSRRTSRRPRP